MLSTLRYLQTNHPRVVTAANWLNPTFTVGTFTLNHDLTIKVLAFLFVTVPLGIVQWWSLYDKWQERRAKKHGQSNAA